LKQIKKSIQDYKMSRERNMERYYTDEEFRKQKKIEKAKISVKY
jgi:hypothetical protein